MSAVMSTKTTSITVTHHLSYSGVDVSGYVKQARVTAILLGIHFMTYKEEANASELGKIEAILGREVCSLVHTYVRKYIPPRSPLTAEGLTDRQAMYAKWGAPDSARCSAVMRLILDSPLCAILEDDECRSADGTVLLVHPVKIESTEKRTTLLAEEKFAALRARTKASSVTIFAISKMAMASLMHIIKSSHSEPSKREKSSAPRESCSVQ